MTRRRTRILTVLAIALFLAVFARAGMVLAYACAGVAP